MAIYIQNHIPVKLREDLMLNIVEVIWLQVHLPPLKCHTLTIESLFILYFGYGVV